MSSCPAPTGGYPLGLVGQQHTFLRMTAKEWFFLSERLTPEHIELFNFQLSCDAYGIRKELERFGFEAQFDVAFYREWRILQTRGQSYFAMCARFDGVWLAGRNRARNGRVSFYSYTAKESCVFYGQALRLYDHAFRTFLTDTFDHPEPWKPE